MAELETYWSPTPVIGWKVYMYMDNYPDPLRDFVMDPVPQGEILEAECKVFAARHWPFVMMCDYCHDFTVSTSCDRTGPITRHFLKCQICGTVAEGPGLTGHFPPCGFYAFKLDNDPEAIVADIQRQAMDFEWRHALTLVALHGTVLEGETGYRATKMEVLEIGNVSSLMWLPSPLRALYYQQRWRGIIERWKETYYA